MFWQRLDIQILPYIPWCEGDDGVLREVHPESPWTDFYPQGMWIDDIHHQWKVTLFFLQTTWVLSLKFSFYSKSMMDCYTLSLKCMAQPVMQGHSLPKPSMRHWATLKMWCMNSTPSTLCFGSDEVVFSSVKCRLAQVYPEPRQYHSQF